MHHRKISTCFWFDHEAEEAAEFYASLIPNSRILARTRFGGYGPQPEGTVLTVTFELDGTEYTALNGGPHFRLSEAASIVVACESQAEIDRVIGSERIPERLRMQQVLGPYLEPSDARS